MLSRHAIIAGLIAAALATGCKTDAPPTGDEIRQQAGTLATMDLTRPWRAGPAASAESDGLIADNWLATFDDAQLSELIAEGIANNADLRVAATRVEIAGQYVELAKAKMRPQVNLFGTGGLNMGGGDVASALQGLSLGVGWEPDLWARMRYGRNAAQATFSSVQADFEFGRQSLAATIAKAWFTAIETSLQLRIAESVIASAEDLVKIAETRRRVGPGREEDVALARANLGSFQDKVQQLELAHDQARRALELLIGRYPAAELAVRTDLIAMPGPIPIGLPIEMLERRPDLIAAERRVAAAFNRVGEAKAARLPRIILNANITVISSDILQLKDDFSNPTGGVGAKIIAPIYDGGELKTQVVIRTLEQKEAIAQYARIALQALGDVENALAAGQSLADREAMLRQILTDHQRVLELAKTNYRVGSGDMRAVQQQQVEVNAAQLALLRVQSEQLAQRVNLHLALGGSFEEQPSATTSDASAADPASQPTAGSGG